jgi:hypothetical protein
MEVEHAQRVEHSPPDLLSGLAEDLEGDGHVIEDRPVEEQAEVLEDDPHRSPELVDPVAGDLQDVDAVDDDLSPAGQKFPEDDLEQGGFAGTAGAGDEIEVPAPDLEADVGQGPLRRLVLFVNVKQLDQILLEPV